MAELLYYNEQREAAWSPPGEERAALVVAHNHPSGNPEPSREDVAVTKQLVEAGNLMGIQVHDHIIIAGRSYTSLAERGLM